MSGWLEMAIRYRSRRRPLKPNCKTLHRCYVRAAWMAFVVFLLVPWMVQPAFGQAISGPVRITVDEAIQMALQHNHNMIAARTAIDQSVAQEVTANMRPKPNLIGDWEYLPFFSPSNFSKTYLSDSTEIDGGISYLIERGHKRQARYQAAKD